MRRSLRATTTLAVVALTLTACGDETTTPKRDAAAPDPLQTDSRDSGIEVPPGTTELPGYPVVTPGRVAFTGTVGDALRAQQVVVENRGQRPLPLLLRPPYPAPFLLSGSCLDARSTTLPASSKCTIDVGIDTTKPVTDATATLAVLGDPQNTAKLNLSATLKDAPKPPVATLSATRLELRSTLGGEPVRSSLTVRNDGGTPLKLSPPPADDEMVSYEGTCRDKTELAPTEACTTTVLLTPRQPVSTTRTLTISGTTNASVPVILFVAAPEAPRITNTQAMANYVLMQSQQARMTVSEPLKHAPPAAPPPPSVAVNTAQDGSQYGWMRNEASLPVDFSRTILRYTPIPATMVETSVTDLGCEITAAISRDVWAHRPGDRPLISKFSRAEGRCLSLGREVKRLAIIWDRLITTDDRIINLHGSTHDPMGRVGANGHYDSRWFQRYGTALAVTVLTAGGTFLAARDSVVSQQSNPYGGVSTSQTMSPAQQATAQARNDIQTILQQMLQEDAAIPPRLDIPRGTPILIYTTEDLYFRDQIVMPLAQYEASMRQAQTPTYLPRGDNSPGSRDANRQPGSQGQPQQPLVYPNQPGLIQRDPATGQLYPPATGPAAPYTGLPTHPAYGTAPPYPGPGYPAQPMWPTSPPYPQPQRQ